jgi:hypothetical protein
MRCDEARIFAVSQPCKDVTVGTVFFLFSVISVSCVEIFLSSG